MHMYLCFFTGQKLSCVLSPLPEFPQKLRQPQNPGVPVVMDTPSGGKHCEELKRIPPRELYVPGYRRVEQQLGPGGDGSP